MYHSGSGSNGLAVLVDSRTKTCKDLHCCLDLYGAGIRFLGREEWKKTLRIAIRDYGDDPHKPKELEHEKEEIRSLLRLRKIRAVIVLQSPNHLSVRKCDHSFSVVGPGGSPYKWAGTCWPIDIGDYTIFCCPILNPSNYEHVYEYLIRRWFQQAHAVARGTVTPLQFGAITTEADETMALGLEAILTKKEDVAVDIETNLAHTIITAIGFSNGTETVSIPWDAFKISGTDETEPGLCFYAMGRRIKSLAIEIMESGIPKILHNGAFDVYELQSHGITLNSFIYDTLLLHRVCYAQFRHGLQQAAATELCVEPWKCLWKPPNRLRGTNHDPWLSDPNAMHIYNGKDALITWHLLQRLRTKISI